LPPRYPPVTPVTYRYQSLPPRCPPVTLPLPSRYARSHPLPPRCPPVAPLCPHHMPVPSVAPPLSIVAYRYVPLPSRYHPVTARYSRCTRHHRCPSLPIVTNRYLPVGPSLTHRYPSLPIVTSPLIVAHRCPIVTHRYPSLPIVTCRYRRYHRYQSLPIVTHRYPSLPIVTIVTNRYQSLPIVTPSLPSRYHPCHTLPAVLVITTHDHSEVRLPPITSRPAHVHGVPNTALPLCPFLHIYPMHGSDCPLASMAGVMTASSLPQPCLASPPALASALAVMPPSAQPHPCPSHPMPQACLMHASSPSWPLARRQAGLTGSPVKRKGVTGSRICKSAVFAYPGLFHHPGSGEPFRKFHRVPDE
jgi:hypothetical protein